MLTCVQQLLNDKIQTLVQINNDNQIIKKQSTPEMVKLTSPTLSFQKPLLEKFLGAPATFNTLEKF